MSILQLRLDPVLEQALVDRAQREERSPAQQALFILRRALQVQPYTKEQHGDDATEEVADGAAA